MGFEKIIRLGDTPILKTCFISFFEAQSKFYPLSARVFNRKEMGFDLTA